MEQDKALDAIHDLAMSLGVENDVERMRKGIELIHALARHKSVATMQPDIDAFNQGGDKDPGQRPLGRVGGTPLSNDPLS